MFKQAFVINLPFKADRLEKFQTDCPWYDEWDVKVWPAVHGDSVQHPSWWRAGRGAWGCYRSHLQILEHCYQQGIESYIVFEDDAIFRSDAREKLLKFMGEVPDDWQQIYLGGQLLHTDNHPPRKLSEHVYVPYNVNRTHCFAVHRRGYERLYTHLNETPFAPSEHVDHHSGRLHETGTWNVYCPDKWIVGQDAGPSNISGNNNSAQFWTNPDGLAFLSNVNNRPVPSVFLESTIDVAVELERRGWHRGHWQNEQRLDRGVCNAISGLNLRGDLLAWHKSVMPEAVREGKTAVCLFHPTLIWDQVQTLGIESLHRIVAADADDAERQLQKRIAETLFESVRPKRNLIYHIWPRKGNGTWKWNLDQLIKRIEQFDGVRSIAIATSDDCDSVADVKKAFDGIRVDNWIVNPNDRSRGEGVSFVKLMETLPQDDSITFYGHAKGASYTQSNANQEWSEALYETCLDDPEHIQALMRDSLAAGPFRMESPGWSSESKKHWHYSGTFFWFKNSGVFSNPRWSVISSDFYGVERWIGGLLPQDQCADIFGAGMEKLHEESEYKKMRIALDEWKKRRRTPENEKDERGLR